jgi:hypothetical protein
MHRGRYFPGRDSFERATRSGKQRESEREKDRERERRRPRSIVKTATSLQWPAPRGRALDNYALFFDTLLLLSQSSRRRHQQLLTALVSLQAYIKGYSAPRPNPSSFFLKQNINWPLQPLDASSNRSREKELKNQKQNSVSLFSRFV